MKSGLIIEDHPKAQQWLADALQTAFPGIAVQIAASLGAGHALLDRSYPDVVLVDLNLPDGSGIELLARISRESPGATAVVATIYDDDDHLFPALRAGARGYILKEQRKEEISRLLQGIVRGEPPLSPAISQRILSFFTAGVVPAQTANPLSEREQQVLSLIACGNSVNAVAESLGVSRNTVATQIKSIYSKLNISTRAEAALAATRLGILKPPGSGG